MRLTRRGERACVALAVTAGALLGAGTADLCWWGRCADALPAPAVTAVYEDGTTVYADGTSTCAVGALCDDTRDTLTP